MPITENIWEHQIIGRERKRGAVMVLRVILEKRFGTLPEWAHDRLTAYPSGKLEGLAARVLDAQSLEELLPLWHEEPKPQF
jgi:hypothetical protein